jgi:hypothetical protein
MAMLNNQRVLPTEFPNHEVTSRIMTQWIQMRDLAGYLFSNGHPPRAQETTPEAELM